MIIGKTIETLLGNLRDSFNRLVNGKQVVGSETIDVFGQIVRSLTVPPGATEAIMRIEIGGTATLSTVARWSISSTAPVPSNSSVLLAGMPIMAMETITIKGEDALKAFRIVSRDNVTTGAFGLKVIYFK